MITELGNYEIISIEELNDIFKAHYSNQHELSLFPSIFSNARNKLVQWVIQICQKLYLKPETMHRTICMFDAYISLNKKKWDVIDINELKFMLVACLSISTKLNELNANYIKFFTDQILNSKNSNIKGKQYSYEDLSLTEMLLIRYIDYNTNAPNVYHFNSIFMRICLIEIDSSITKEALIRLNSKVLNSFLLTKYVVQLSAVNSAIMVLNETLTHFYHNKNNSTSQLIINKIQKMLWANDNNVDNQNQKLNKSSQKKEEDFTFANDATPNISIESSTSTKIED